MALRVLLLRSSSCPPDGCLTGMRMPDLGLNRLDPVVKTERAEQRRKESCGY